MFESHTKLDVQETDFSFTHTSTEAEIISLDADSRMDGIPALDLWDLVKEVFHSSPNQFNSTKDQVRGNSSRNTTSNKQTQNQTKVPTQHVNYYLSDVDYAPSNAKFSRFGAMLYTFEDNEAVIKIIINGRSPTMRHVSRTHGVVLDWLFDRINLDPQDSNQVCRLKTPTCRHIDKRESHVMSGTIFLICLKNQPFQLTLLLSEFQLDQLH